jgi:hypothetical protein
MHGSNLISQEFLWMVLPLIAALVVCLSEQTFLFETRNLGLPEISKFLGLGAVLGYESLGLARSCEEKKSCWDLSRQC